jgi:hypothetical protein
MGRVAWLAMIIGFGWTGGRADELPNPPPCTSCFIGTLQLSPDPSDATLKILESDLYFVGSDKVVWKAGKGDKTDGASIPPLFQPIIGGPWEADYLPAAVMHDHYCDEAHRVHTWRETDRMFYEAMIVNHTDVIKAKTMYYAVYAFGPHWGKLQSGVPCGPNCVFSVTTQMTFRAATYSMVHEAELKSVESRIRGNEVIGEPLSLNDIEDLAEKAYRQDPFLHDGTK